MAAVPSTKPYLIRAIYDWCVDGGLTPHIVVKVDATTQVPVAYVHDGQIVLNIAAYATHQLAISNEEITCQARFGGVAHSLRVPIANVAAIYARENGQGMSFEVDGAVAARLAGDVPAADDDDNRPPAQPDGAPDTPPPAGGRSHLRVVK